MVEAPRQRKDARPRNRTEGRLVAMHAAERCRADHRAAGLRAQRHRHHAVRHRRRRTAGRATRRAARVVRIARGARPRHGELGGDGLAQDHRARIPQELGHEGIAFRLMAGEQIGAVFRRHICGIDDILEADRNTVQRSLDLAPRAGSIEGSRLGQCRVGRHMHPGFDIGLARLDTVQARTDQFFRGQFTRRHGLGGGSGAHGRPLRHASLLRDCPADCFPPAGPFGQPRCFHPCPV